MSHPSHPPPFDCPNNAACVCYAVLEQSSCGGIKAAFFVDTQTPCIWWAVQIVQLVILQFLQPPVAFSHFRFIYVFCMDWMELAQDRYRWRALVGRVGNLRVPKMWGIS
jgi:hypothetical protein